MSNQLSVVSRKLSPGQKESTTPVSNTARLIEAPEAPSPNSCNGDLLEALADFLDPKFECVRESAWRDAIELCIELEEGVCFEWLSRRHDMDAPNMLQLDAKVRLPLLSAKDLAWVRQWNQKRELTVSIEFDLAIAGLEQPLDNLPCIVNMLAEPGFVTHLTLGNGCQDFYFMHALSEKIELNQDLKTLTIKMRGAKLAGMERLAQALSQNTALQKLTFSRLQCKGGDFAVLCEALIHNDGIEAFALVKTQGSSADASALCKLLQAEKLRALDLSYSSFDAPAYADPILEAIARNQSLTKLALMGWVVDIRCADTLSPLLSDPRFFDLKIGTFLAKDAKETSDLLKAALDANPSLCAFDSHVEDLREHGKQRAMQNLRRFQQQQQQQLALQAPEALIRLAANMAAPVEINKDVTHLILRFLTSRDQAHLLAILPWKDQ